MKLPVVSGEKAIKAFLDAGFVKVRQCGSHVGLENISHRLRRLIGYILHRFPKKYAFLWFSNFYQIRIRMARIRRIFTDLFFIRAHPRHPWNPCSITILLLTDDKWIGKD